MITLGRKRKPLKEKSTVLMIRIDNELIFSLCDKFEIEYDPDAEILSDVTKKALVAEISNNLQNIIK